MAGTSREELWAWKGFQSNKKIDKLIPLATIWVIWNKRNKRAFMEANSNFMIDLRTLGSRSCIFH